MESFFLGAFAGVIAVILARKGVQCLSMRSRVRRAVERVCGIEPL